MLKAIFMVSFALASAGAWSDSEELHIGEKLYIEYSRGESTRFYIGHAHGQREIQPDQFGPELRKASSAALKLFAQIEKTKKVFAGLPMSSDENPGKIMERARLLALALEAVLVSHPSNINLDDVWVSHDVRQGSMSFYGFYRTSLSQMIDLINPLIRRADSGMMETVHTALLNREASKIFWKTLRENYPKLKNPGDLYQHTGLVRTMFKSDLCMKAVTSLGSSD